MRSETAVANLANEGLINDPSVKTVQTEVHVHHQKIVKNYIIDCK